MKAKIGDIIYYEQPKEKNDWGIAVTLIAENQYSILQSHGRTGEQSMVYVNRKQLEEILKEEKVSEWKNAL